MNTKEEKLSLLTEMISFAKSDNELNEAEYNFLVAVANHIGINKTEFDGLMENPAPHKALKPESARIVQFHRLVLLMNIDQKIKDEELVRLHEIGLKMGLHPDAINKVLDVMDSYENKVVPPNVLIDIFKTHYN